MSFRVGVALKDTGRLEGSWDQHGTSSSSSSSSLPPPVEYWWRVKWPPLPGVVIQVEPHLGDADEVQTKDKAETGLASECSGNGGRLTGVGKWKKRT